MSNIGPKKKRSIAKKHIRHAAWERDILKKLSNMVALANCSNCQAVTLAHRVCKACGFYHGKQVISIKASGKNKVIDA